LLKQEKDLGSIATGKKADLLLIDREPAQNNSDIRCCNLVVKNGTLYKRDALYASAGIKPAN
jgi:imidazolonepropionase-like amidohydrolase